MTKRVVNYNSLSKYRDIIYYLSSTTIETQEISYQHHINTLKDLVFEQPEKNNTPKRKSLKINHEIQTSNGSRNITEDIDFSDLVELPVFAVKDAFFSLSLKLDEYDSREKDLLVRVYSGKKSPNYSNAGLNIEFYIENDMLDIDSGESND